MKLISATANPHKYKEMQQILPGKIELLPRPPEIPEIVEDAPVPSEQEDDEPEQEKQSASGGDVIHCPDCEQKLKVPYERRPVRARCPACKCEFLAKKE